MIGILFYYLILINLIGFILMFVDKDKAKKKKWRISEATLFTVSIVGGSIGVLLGMYSFRHKTKHTKFTVGIPVIIILQYFFVFYINEFM